MQDLRYAFRTFRKTPAPVLLAVLAIGIGIGANTAIFSVVRAVLLKPLPYAAPHRLVAVFESNTAAGTPRVDTAIKNYEDWRDQTSSFENVAASAYWIPSLTGLGDAEQILAGHVTENFFDTLGVHPVIGRDFTGAEDQPGRNTVVILSHAFWTDRLARDPAVLGRKLLLDNAAYTVIGVMPPEFFPPDIERRRQAVQLWRPLGERGNRDRGPGYLRVFARLKPSVTLEQARSEIAHFSQRIALSHPQYAAFEGRTVPLATAVAGDTREPLQLLFGSVGVLLLIACANIANLLLARAAGRRGEFAIRAALGAGRPRLVRQVLTESLLLGIGGGVLGLFLAFWSRDALGALSKSFVPSMRPVELDVWVLAFTGCVSLLTGLLFGLFPALDASRTTVRNVLAAGRPSRIPSLLVISEVALTLVLLTTAGLLLRSFWNVQSQGLGYEPRHVLTAEIRLKRGQEQTAYNLTFMTGLITRVKALPGVEVVSIVDALPLSGRNNDSDFFIEGRPAPAPNTPNETMLNFCTPEYFRVMKMRLISGRLLDASDAGGKPEVVVINETLAHRYFSGESPLGKRIKLTPEWQTIVGVVADTRHKSLIGAPQSQVYLSFAQHPLPRMTLALRTAGDPVLLVNAIRRELAALDPQLPLGNVRTIEQILDQAVAPRRLSMLLVFFFAAAAIVLAAIGIYGVVSSLVAYRNKEIGVRMALGAQRLDVLALVLHQGFRMVLIGLAIGLALSLAIARSLGTMLFNIAPSDPVTIVFSVAMLVIVATLAILVPARRAARVDPAVAMRCE